MSKDNDRTPWDRFAAKMAALGVDPLRPFVGEDDPRFNRLHTILAEFGGVAPLPPLPPKWEGRRPVDYDRTFDGVARWLEFEWRGIMAQGIFPGAGETSLAHLNTVISNAYRAMAHFGIVDPPKREARAATITIAKQRLETLLGFVQAKAKSGWESPTTDLPKEGIVVIDHWADLRIGIDDDWKYYAFPKCPTNGERVKLRDGIVLRLKGATRWPKVLPCFARSHDGKTAEKEELEMELGYHKKGAVSEGAVVFGDGLVEKTKTPSDRLRVTMAGLGKELRELVNTKDTAKVFESNGDYYNSAFTTRHLFRDGDGNITFGRAE